MTTQLSPLGDSRSHRVPCLRCGTLTWNWSGACIAHLDDDGEALEAWAPDEPERVER